MTLTIKTKLAVVLMVLTLALMAVGTFGLYANQRSNDALKETYSC
ncbi:Tar ligand binding domain-containing protein [Ralstonia pickettii]|nr:Tar ligand binding domain-containing protein [Ralstonia pickettii]WKZ86483.1 Tar ligand binding domain-containing protein [Ralstonia pickettii]